MSTDERADGPRTIFYTAATLDGFLADERHSLDWLMSSDHDPEGAMPYEPFIAGVGALLMGSSTYRWVLGNLAAQPEAEQRWTYEQPTFVLTSAVGGAGELRRPPGADVRFRSAPAAEVHAELVEVAGERDRWVVGGGRIAADLAEAGLLDELWISIAPVTVGQGAPLLPTRSRWDLVEVLRNRDFACLRYARMRPEPVTDAPPMPVLTDRD